MNASTSLRIRAAALLAGAAGLAGCDRDLAMLEPAPFPPEAEVFYDAFGPGVQFSAFGGSKVDALGIERDDVYRGTAALKFTIPAPTDPSGGYAGGVFFSTAPRDLSGFDALTFWAKSSTAAVLNTVGVGNDNTGNSRYPATVDRLPLSTRWTKYALPLPLPSKLAEERGLFLVAEGSEFPVGYDILFDDVQFERLGTIVNPRPAIATQTVNGEVGTMLSVGGTQVTFDANGADVVVQAAPAYFTFASSNSGVASVTPDGSISLVGSGTATITAMLGSTAAAGAVTVNVSAPPTGAPPAPERPAEEVISLFSDAYADVTVDTWSAEWDQADVADVAIAGNALKKYTNLAFAGIEFTSQPVDASAMSHLHVDLWTNDPSAFRIKLVDFGANGVFGGGDDSEHEITLDTGSMPPIAEGQWNTLDIPLADFAGLAGRGKLAQMIISGSSPTVYLDNIYFYSTTPKAPEEPAPAPTMPADKVISLFSDAYDDRVVDTWSASWDQADVEDVQVAGDNVKKYSNLTFAGIEFTSAVIDASAMTHFHFDVWTPDPTADPASFRVKLVDFGADGVWSGGGDDSEHEVAFTAASDPPLATGAWIGYDIAFADLTALAGRTSLAQLIVAGDPNTVFLDNLYFYDASTAPPTEPAMPAPAPTHAAEDVISLFSDAYDDRTVDTWSASWDAADLEDVQVAGDNVKKYTNLTFAGIEFTSAVIDASGMTHFHIDIWTPDPTADAAFKVKLVDFGADGAWSGGDDSEHEITFTAASSPPLATGKWIGLDIAFADLTALAGRTSLAQLIISGDPNTVFVDNVYFRK